jgi:hypothetical protein
MVSDFSSVTINDLQMIAQEAQQVFGQLNQAQLNWKPSANQWSVAQCFDHLITANEHYFPIINTIINGEKRTTIWERMPFLPGLFGNLLVKNLQPDAPRKLKAPAIFQPSSSNLDAEIIQRFVAHQHQLAGLIQSASTVDLHMTIITSPSLSFITYSLYDAYRLLVVHEKRHFEQARRVLASTQFPQASFSSLNAD